MRHPIPTRHAVALAIRRPHDPSRVLLVLRPPDDADLPEAWGLPASTLRPGESHETAARRTGREKLGVEIEPGAELNRGEIRRPDYVLSMRLLDATLCAGEPRVPQPRAGVTQYRAWRWGTAQRLRPAADLGSLCCRLFLASAP